MTKANSSKTVLLVDADPKEVMQLHQDMPEWLWIEAPNGWLFEKETEPTAQSFQAIIVFTEQSTEARTLAVCKHICEKQLLNEVPLLVAGNRYQMALGHAVKRLPRGSFIFTPIEEESLLKEIEKSRVKQS